MHENKMSASSDSAIFIFIILLTNCMCNLYLNLQNNSEVFMLQIANQTFFINIPTLFPFVILFYIANRGSCSSCFSLPRENRLCNQGEAY